MKFLTLLFMIVFLSACGGGHNPDKVPKENILKVGSSAYTEIAPGQWLMSEVLKDVSLGANFELSFSLADQGVVTVHAFSNPVLAEGVNIQFTRKASALLVAVGVRDITQDWSSYFSTVDASQALTFTFDVHNQERPAHILVWQGSKNASLNHRNTIYNSAEDSVDLGFAGSPGNGSHRHWGISFSQAEITKALISPPQETHE